jgi:hypothetical protein
MSSSGYVRRPLPPTPPLNPFMSVLQLKAHVILPLILPLLEE